MSLTKHILKEFISDAKRDAIHKKIFLNMYGIKNPNHPLNTKLYDAMTAVNDQFSDHRYIGSSQILDDYIKLDYYIQAIDNTPNKKYVEWFFLKSDSIQYQDKYKPAFSDAILGKLLSRIEMLIQHLQVGDKPRQIKLAERLEEIHKEYRFTNGLFAEKRIDYYYGQINEDIPRINDAFDWHFKLKQRKDFPQQYKDINNIKSFEELMRIIKPYKAGIEMDFDKVVDSINEGTDYKDLYQDDEVQIYKPLTEKGACVLGYKTEWCTTWGSQSLNADFKDRGNHFGTYDDLESFYEPPIYIFRWKNQPEESNTKYVQMYLGIHQRLQVMGVDDNEVAKVEQYLKKLDPKVSDVILDNLFETFRFPDDLPKLLSAHRRWNDSTPFLGSKFVEKFDLYNRYNERYLTKEKGLTYKND
jgi:hypothetical protein